jgi:hypothetical protein
VAVVVDDHVPSLYVNGNLIKRGIRSGKNTFLPVSIGTDSIQYGRFYGELDDMIFYSRPLAAQEVGRIYRTTFKNRQADPATGD